MDFNEAPLRRVRLLRGYGALVVAAVLLVSVLTLPNGGSAVLVGGLFAGLIALGGVIQIWLAHRTSPTEMMSHGIDPNRLELSDRRRYFRNQLILSAAALGGMSVWMAFQINRLEAGTVDRVRLWSPIALLYDHLGYWPAVLASPFVGVLLCGFWVFKLTNADD